MKRLLLVITAASLRFSRPRRRFSHLDRRRGRPNRRRRRQGNALRNGQEPRRTDARTRRRRSSRASWPATPEGTRTPSPNWTPPGPPWSPTSRPASSKRLRGLAEGTGMPLVDLKRAYMIPVSGPLLVQQHCRLGEGDRRRQPLHDAEPRLEHGDPRPRFPLHSGLPAGRAAFPA